MTIKKTAENQIQEIILNALARCISENIIETAPIPAFKVEIPNDKNNGDFSTNAAFICTRLFKKNPAFAAEQIYKKIDLTGTYFEKAETAGGFINFTLAPSYYADVLLTAFNKNKNYGKSDLGKGKKINVEFVSANPTGPMHMGNARGGALGDCLSAVLQKAGYEVSKEFYINDAGNQIEKFGLSLSIRYQQLINKGNTPELPEDSYHGQDIIERAKEYIEINGDRLMSVSEDERRKRLVDFSLPKNIDGIKKCLAKYRIDYDVWFHESELHKGAVKEVIDELTENGFTYEKDGALWYKNIEVQEKALKAQGKSDKYIEKLGLKDDVLIRQNGNPTYFAADIAYHKNKLITRGFDKSIDIWGADHYGHIARLKGALSCLGIDENRLTVVLMQLVNLKRDGIPVRMSKRTGNAITLNDLLDEVPIDSARFFFNLREPGSTIDFDLDLALKEDSDNPVYYCQYANARINSVLQKLNNEDFKFQMPDKKDLELLISDEERELISLIAKYPEEIEFSAETLDPAVITKYLIELSALFHKFYNAQRIAVENSSLRNARTLLIKTVQDLIKTNLEMFKITVPEKM